VAPARRRATQGRLRAVFPRLDPAQARRAARELHSSALKSRALGVALARNPAAALRDGWHTGDTGYLDDAGRLFVLGRERAMIKRAGGVVAPRELYGVIRPDPAPGGTVRSWSVRAAATCGPAATGISVWAAAAPAGRTSPPTPG
jgi:acyl-CoA synthetase (AMP-forming)/AMP-acid ligase II